MVLQHLDPEERPSSTTTRPSARRDAETAPATGQIDGAPASAVLLALQRTVGNAAVARMLAAEQPAQVSAERRGGMRSPDVPRALRGIATEQTVDPPTVQRAIGDLGEAAVGRLLRRSGRPVAGYRVVGTRESDGRRQYQVQDKNGFAPALWVDADTTEYEPAQETPMSEEDEALQAKIDSLIRSAPGSASALLNDRPAKLVAQGVGMGEMASSRGDLTVLWSAGAADCVIVGAIGKSGAWITHADRTGPSPETIANEIAKIGGKPRIYLASQMFTKPNAAASELIRGIMNALRDFSINAIFKTTGIAFDAVTGTVVADLSAEDRKLLSVGSGWESIARPGA